MIVTSLLQFFQLAVLTRVLPASDFGLMAMIVVVVAFGQAYADIGVSNAIIHRQDATRDQLASLYWLNAFAGWCVFAAVVLLSPAIAGFYREPRLRGLLCAAAAVFLISPLGQQFQVLFQKHLRFRPIALIQMCAYAVGAAAAISCALLGLGVASLIIGQLAAAAVAAGGFCVAGWRSWRPALHFRWSDTKGYMSFGLYQMGERTVNQLSANLDYLIIGRLLGPTALGVYAVAYQLMVMPFARMNPVITRVAFPVFALRQDDHAALQRGYLRVASSLVFFVFPVLAGLMVLAPVAVPALFGARWQGAVPLVQVLGIMALLKTLTNPSGSMFLAIGRADVGFYLNIVLTGAAFTAFMIAARSGVLAVAWSWAGLAALGLVSGLVVLRRLTGLSLTRYFSALLRPVIVVALMAIIVQLLHLALRSLVHDPVALLVVLAPLSVVVYLALWFLIDAPYTRSLLGALIGRSTKVV